MTGYALLFKDRPIVFYSEPLTNESVIVNYDDKILPSEMNAIMNDGRSEECVAHLFKIEIEGVGDHEKKQRINAQRISKVRRTSVADLDKFLLTVRSEVLNKRSVCATTQ